MKTLPLSLAIASALSASMMASIATAEQTTEAVELDVVTVSADFRDTNVQELAEAVTVIGADDIEARSAQHLESVLSFAPNVNFSSGASRGRYFQIRGIGERSQFVDPVNPSVGLMIDGIDMTGLGGAATLFDVQQVEVLRGPQGTRFGANALAGMINIKSKDATKDSEGYVAAKVGNYSTHNESAAISGSVTENIQARLAINSFQSDGYMENEFLDKDNTNNIDEVVVRGKLAAQLSENTNLGLTYFYADIDNGYDAFSLENNRKTYSDEPGIDAQESHAFALNLDSKLSSAVILETVLTKSKSDVEYSYDEDWGYGEHEYGFGDCLVNLGPCYSSFGYDSIDQYLRDYQRNSLDIRLLSAENSRIFSESTDWVVGFYHQARSEGLVRNYTWDPQYTSTLDVTSTSIYAELTTDLSAQTRIIYGVRAEQWQNDFENSLNTDSDETETLFGGQVTFESLINNDHLGYVSLARGYKAGGANSATVISEDKRTFDTEYNNTLEVGLKSSMLNDELVTRIAAFYIQRQNQQVKQSFISYKTDGAPKFTEYVANAAEGINQGIELESQWQLLEDLRWDLSVGYLKTKFTDYEFSAKDDDDVNNVNKTIDKKGRAQAHAPEYSLATGLSFSATPDVTFSVESEAKDTFYFSDSHDEQSKAYVLWHARITFEKGPLQTAVFARNLTGKEYATRGFGFDNNYKAGFDLTQHTQLGAPRLVGIETRYSF